ncbi:MAG: circadian clock protein KaiB [Chloroflexi bacterium]|nr:circadian clock protein KaiB [Chloroflexota bacterium]
MSTKAHPDYADTDSVPEWELRLFVTDWTPRCVVAYKNLNRICDEHLKDKCKIELVDLLETPEVARQEQIVAIPTLMKMSPLPQKLMVGDFTDEAKVLKALGIEPPRLK